MLNTDCKGQKQKQEIMLFSPVNTNPKMEEMVRSGKVRPIMVTSSSTRLGIERKNYVNN